MFFVQRPDIEFSRYRLRYNIRRFASVSNDSVELRVWFRVLSQHIYSMKHQLRRVKRISALPWRRRGMSRSAVKFIHIGSKALQFRTQKITVVKMNHNRHIISVKGASFCHCAFCAVSFLNGRSDNVNVRIERILQILCRKGCQNADRTAQTMSAGVTDFRQRIIFCQNRNLILVIVRPVNPFKGSRQSGKRILRFISVGL